MTFEFRERPQLRDEVESASGSLVRFAKDETVAAGEVEITRAGDVWRATLPKQLHRANGVAARCGSCGSTESIRW